MQISCFTVCTCMSRKYLSSAELSMSFYHISVSLHVFNSFTEQYFIELFEIEILLFQGHWKPGSAPNDRKLLFDFWGHWKNMFKVQPLEHVRYVYDQGWVQVRALWAYASIFQRKKKKKIYCNLLNFVLNIAIYHTHSLNMA